MKFILLFTLAFATQAFASSLQLEQAQFLLKESYLEKAHEIKIQQESELMSLAGKFQTKSLAAATSCVEFVYAGPSSREEAVAACRGVSSLECVEFVYQGPSSRVEAAQACRGVRDFSCVEFVYRGPATRVEAALACANGRPAPGGQCND